GLTIEVMDLAGDDVVDAVMRGAADVGLMLCAPTDNGIDRRLLRRDTPVAVLRSSHPLARSESLTVAELAEHTLVLWPRTVSKAAHDAVLGMLDEPRPAATRLTEGHSGAAWPAMDTDGLAVRPARAGRGG